MLTTHKYRRSAQNFRFSSGLARSGGGTQSARHVTCVDSWVMAEGESANDVETDDGGSFLQSLMDTELYSIGAYFCDEHPDLVDEVVSRADAIEEAGLEHYAELEGRPIEEGFETLLTGLAVRYYKAVAG